MTGLVLSWKGTFGFIRPDDKKMDDLFVHFENVEPERKGFKELKEGQSVKFDIREGEKGPEAINVEIHDDDRRSLYASEREQQRQQDTRGNN